jgi:hypothetical protein
MPRWRQSPVGPVWRHPVGPWLRAPRLGSWRERHGEAEGVFLPLLSGGRSLCAGTSRRRAASPPPAGGAHELRSADAPSRRGSTLTMGDLGWGGSRGLRYTSPFALAVGHKPRRDALCPSAAPAPGQAGPPSRRPIWPNEPQFPLVRRRNGKRDLARLENREITAVLERGAGLITGRPRPRQPVRAPASPLLSRCAIPPGVGGGLVGGGPAVRYTSLLALAVGQKPRRSALCQSAAPAPRWAGPPSRRQSHRTAHAHLGPIYPSLREPAELAER